MANVTLVVFERDPFGHKPSCRLSGVGAGGIKSQGHKSYHISRRVGGVASRTCGDGLMSSEEVVLECMATRPQPGGSRGRWTKHLRS
jgi:hypothetical protein